MGGFSLLADALLRDSSCTWLILIPTASANRLQLFLDASSHLYNRVYLSVGPSVGPSVRPSVRDTFVKNKRNQYFRANKRQRRFTKLTRCIIASL